MNLAFPYDEHLIEVFDETIYDHESVDNVCTYDAYYPSAASTGWVLSQHGIRLTDQAGTSVRQVCVAASGGCTTVHDHSCILFGNMLTICCADTVFSLHLPDLALVWKTKADAATCLGLYQHGADYVVHGELQISRVDRSGNILWTFSGSNIFVTPTGTDGFSISGDRIYATTWDGHPFILDALTGQLISPP